MANHYLLLLLIAFYGCCSTKAASSSSLFLNIDCGGASKNFTGANNLTWVNDDGYFQTEEARAAVVKNTTGVSKELSTLRAFTDKNKKKNCYTFLVGKGVQILVRVWFYYGNYDGLETVPEFNLHFDSNNWTTVSHHVDEPWYHEVIYVTKRNDTSICFGRIGSGHDPFVSAIEVRTLTLNMYAGVNSSFALYFTERLAFGSTHEIRFPDDKYDRIWAPQFKGYTVLKSNATYVNVSVVDEEPPMKMLLSAATPADPKSNLTIGIPDLPSDPVRIYRLMYYTEMSHLRTGQLRSFITSIDGVSISSAIEPPFRSIDLRYNSAREASSGTKIELVRLSNSTLPPIISGMEIYRISDFLSDRTDLGNVEALLLLQEKFDVLGQWTGDPCLPSGYNWEWVVCDKENPPHITELHLGGYALSGSLPIFSGLTNLEIIDLHNNSLTGDIPVFLGSLPFLRTLNLSMNNFSSIPSSLTQSTTIKLDVTENPKLCNPRTTCDGRNSFRSPPPPSSLFTRSPPPPFPPLLPPPNSAGMISTRVTVQVLLLQMAFFVSTVFVV